MYEPGAVVSQNGMSCSRGLPESWVMMTLSRSTVRMRSRITRYWLMGISSESSCFPHSASHPFLAAATSSLSEASALPPPAPFCRLLVDVGGLVGGMDDGLA